MPESQNLSDEALIALVRTDQPGLYGEIIRRYQEKLTRYVRRFTVQEAVREDILQDVFIKAYRNLHDFDVSRSFSSWIYRIAHNEAINHLKKAQREPLVLDEWEWEVADERLELGIHIDKKDQAKQVSAALQQLKEKYREPLVLYFFEEKTYEEISDILRIPRNTVGTLIARGKTQLKSILEQRHYGTY